MYHFFCMHCSTRLCSSVPFEMMHCRHITENWASNRNSACCLYCFLLVVFVNMGTCSRCLSSAVSLPAVIFLCRSTLQYLAFLFESLSVLSIILFGRVSLWGHDFRLLALYKYSCAGIVDGSWQRLRILMSRGFHYFCNLLH